MASELSDSTCQLRITHNHLCSRKAAQEVLASSWPQCSLQVSCCTSIFCLLSQLYCGSCWSGSLKWFAFDKKIKEKGERKKKNDFISLFGEESKLLEKCFRSVLIGSTEQNIDIALYVPESVLWSSFLSLWGWSRQQLLWIETLLFHITLAQCPQLTQVSYCWQ